MCTAINYINGDHYFGRNLDLEIDFPVSVVITPKNYPFDFRHVGKLTSHHALIGMSLIKNDYPLYFEAANDVGLGMAGLAFHDYAVYQKPQEGKKNLGSFEIIQYILSTCSSVEEARQEFKDIVITDDNFDAKTPNSPLHWIIGDKKDCIVIESTTNGLKVYDNPYGVLTNSPTFDYMTTNLMNFINISNLKPVVRFAPGYDKDFKTFSAGMGTYGLPGGVDSVSRFVRVAFSKLNSYSEKTEEANISQYFHLLGVVSQVRGEDEISPNVYEVTQYSSCANTDKKLFYFSTYDNPNVYCVDMNKENTDGTDLISYLVPKEFTITRIN